jgi:hypothetical protein
MVTLDTLLQHFSSLLQVSFGHKELSCLLIPIVRRTVEDASSGSDSEYSKCVQVLHFYVSDR